MVSDSSGEEDVREVFEKYIAPIFERLDKRKKKLALRFLKEPEKVAKNVISRNRRLFDLRRKMLGLRTRPEWRAFLMMINEYAERKGWICKEGKYEIFLWEKPVSLEYEIREGKLLPKKEEEAKEFAKWLEELEEKNVKDLLKIKTYRFDRIWLFRGILWINWELASKILGKRVPEGEELKKEDVENIANFLLFELRKYLKERRKMRRTCSSFKVAFCP